jgi:hypothetical protein
MVKVRCHTSRSLVKVSIRGLHTTDLFGHGSLTVGKTLLSGSFHHRVFYIEPCDDLEWQTVKYSIQLFFMLF